MSEILLAAARHKMVPWSAEAHWKFSYVSKWCSDGAMRGQIRASSCGHMTTVHSTDMRFPDPCSWLVSYLRDLFDWIVALKKVWGGHQSHLQSQRLLWCNGQITLSTITMHRVQLSQCLFNILCLFKYLNILNDVNHCAERLQKRQRAVPRVPHTPNPNSWTSVRQWHHHIDELSVRECPGNVRW